MEWHRPPEALYPVVWDVSEADRAARSLRDHWSLGIDPIPNLVELLEEQGIKVLAVDLTNIDGLTARVRRSGHGVVPVIVVNRQDWGERLTFRALAERAISESKAAELLGVSVRELNRQMDEPPTVEHEAAGD